jgi:hypothetical protein
MSKQRLVIERPHEDPEMYPWDDGSRRRFHIDDDDADHLLTGNILWRGDTTFTVEDDDD